MEKKKKETVLVGMSGRLDSTVAAYLLKKQGFNVIGVSLVFFDGGDSCSQTGMNCADCHNGDLERTKKICDKLGIPFYGSNGREQFQEKIVEEMVYGYSFFDYLPT